VYSVVSQIGSSFVRSTVLYSSCRSSGRGGFAGEQDVRGFGAQDEHPFPFDVFVSVSVSVCVSFFVSVCLVCLPVCVSGRVYFPTVTRRRGNPLVGPGAVAWGGSMRTRGAPQQHGCDAVRCKLTPEGRRDAGGLAERKLPGHVYPRGQGRPALTHARRQRIVAWRHGPGPAPCARRL
jgi:hypothetical protein